MAGKVGETPSRAYFLAPSVHSRGPFFFFIKLRVSDSYLEKKLLVLCRCVVIVVVLTYALRCGILSLVSSLFGCLSCQVLDLYPSPLLFFMLTPFALPSNACMSLAALPSKYLVSTLEM